MRRIAMRMIATDSLSAFSVNPLTTQGLARGVELTRANAPAERPAATQAPQTQAQPPRPGANAPRGSLLDLRV